MRYHIAKDMKRHFQPLWLLCSSVCLIAAVPDDNSPTPLIQAHAHNDYAHQRPLFDALDHGFCSVEADIYLVDGQLLVAHELRQTKPDRTLQTLYLNPLRERVRQNGGRVYRGGPPCTLLIDIKTDADKTYAALREVLKDYQDLLTVFKPDSTKTNAIAAIITGNRPRQMMMDESVRYAGFDGRLEDLDLPASRHFIPLISDNWTKHFKWRGEGAMAEEEKQKLGEIVAKAHRQGRRLRFWGGPDVRALWQEQRTAGVDLINTDDLPGLQDFLLNRPRPGAGK